MVSSAGRGLARVFAVPAARLTFAVAFGVLFVALLAGIVRVLPLLLAPGVPAAIALPLARGVLGVSLETALFVAPPVAWALAASRLVDRGEARALLSLGVSPLRLIASGWPAALVIAVAAAVSAGSWGREAAAPGRLARGLVATARSACVREIDAARRRAPSSHAPAVVDVPLFGLSWVCFENEAPRIVGPAPFGGGATAFAAAGLDVSDDLRRVSLAELELVTPLGERGSDKELVVRAHRATLGGLAPLGRASNLGVYERMVLLVGSSLAMALFAAGLVVRRAISGRVFASVVGLVGPTVALLVFSALERGSTRPLAYLMVPIAGHLALAVIAVALAVAKVGKSGGADLAGRIARPSGQ